MAAAAAMSTLGKPVTNTYAGKAKPTKTARYETNRSGKVVPDMMLSIAYSVILRKL